MPASKKTFDIIKNPKKQGSSQDENFESEKIKPDFYSDLQAFLTLFIVFSLLFIWNLPIFAIKRTGITENLAFINPALDYVESRVKENGVLDFKAGEQKFFVEKIKNQELASEIIFSENTGSENVSTPKFDEQSSSESSISREKKVGSIDLGGKIRSLNNLPTKLKKPLKILIIGDSLMQENTGIIIENRLRETGFEVKRFAKYSTGLTNRQYFDWENQAKRQIEDFKPEVLIVMFGANDGQNIMDENRRMQLYGSPNWNRLYENNVRSFLKTNSSLVKKLYFIGLPIAGSPDFREKFSRFNGIYEGVSSEFANVVFIPTWDRFAVNGQYSPIISDESGNRGRVKFDDGVHLTDFGSSILYSVLSQKMADDIEF